MILRHYHTNLSFFSSFQFNVVMRVLSALPYGRGRAPSDFPAPKSDGSRFNSQKKWVALGKRRVAAVEGFAVEAYSRKTAGMRPTPSDGAYGRSLVSCYMRGRPICCFSSKPSHRLTHILGTKIATITNLAVFKK
jgi:hypothetical protein